jgi:hypothetical protein
MLGFTEDGVVVGAVWGGDGGWFESGWGGGGRYSCWERRRRKLGEHLLDLPRPLLIQEPYTLSLKHHHIHQPPDSQNQ